MKNYLLSLVALCLLASCLAYTELQSRALFRHFIVQHQKTYHVEEVEFRYAIFKVQYSLVFLL